jgi:hypothetical protein
VVVPVEVPVPVRAAKYKEANQVRQGFVQPAGAERRVVNPAATRAGRVWHSFAKPAGVNGVESADLRGLNLTHISWKPVK